MAEASRPPDPAWLAARAALWGHAVMKGGEEERPGELTNRASPLVRKDSGLNTLPGVGSVQVGGRGPSRLPGSPAQGLAGTFPSEPACMCLLLWHALNYFLAALLED